MTEQWIFQWIPERIKQLGLHSYHIRYRDFTIRSFDSLTLQAYNELWYVVDDPPGILIESDYGIYDSTGLYLFENIHEHRGRITISNPDSEMKKIKLVQVIIVN